MELNTGKSKPLESFTSLTIEHIMRFIIMKLKQESVDSYVCYFPAITSCRNEATEEVESWI